MEKTVKNALVPHQADDGVVSSVTGAVFEGGKVSLAFLTKIASMATKVGVGLPLVVGAGMGMAASKLTSPSLEDNKALEKRVELARIEAMVKENRRKQQVMDKRLRGKT